jgi:hypothetical protein
VQKGKTQVQDMKGKSSRRRHAFEAEEEEQSAHHFQDSCESSAIRLNGGEGGEDSDTPDDTEEHHYLRAGSQETPHHRGGSSSGRLCSASSVPVPQLDAVVDGGAERAEETSLDVENNTSSAGNRVGASSSLQSGVAAPLLSKNGEKNDEEPFTDVVVVRERASSVTGAGIRRYGSILGDGHVSRAGSPSPTADAASDDGSLAIFESKYSEQFLQQSKHHFLEAGWHFSAFSNHVQMSFSNTSSNSRQVISAMVGEVFQDPPGLHIRKVDVNERLRAMASGEFPSTYNLIFFWVHNGTYLIFAFFCCVAYLLIPCSVPTSFTQFVFLNRLAFDTVAVLAMVVMGLLLLKERARWSRSDIFLVLAMVVAYDAQDISKMFLLSQQSWFADYVQVFNGFNWALGMSLYFYWLRREHPSIAFKSKVCLYYILTVAVLFAYVCLLELFTVKFEYLSSLGQGIQTLTFIAFFVWTNLCIRLLQMLTRRIQCSIARLERRPVTWHDLLRAQMFVFFAHCAQLSYYRLLFINVHDWYMEGVLIAVHVIQETLLYPVRLLESVRGLERRVMADLPAWLRFVAYPVLPLSVWMDLHCADYFLRKLAEVSTLVVFVSQLLLFRGGYMAACYTTTTFTAERYASLFYLCSVLLFIEVVSGLLVVHRVVYGRAQRGFLFHHLVRSKLNRTFLAIAIVVTSCSSTFADALRHVKF